MITPGAPGMDTPYTFISLVTNCTWYQIEGKVRSKCGSFSSIGKPVLVLLPDTAQLLLPITSSFSLVFIPAVAVGAVVVVAEGTGTFLKFQAVPLGIMGSSRNG